MQRHVDAGRKGGLAPHKLRGFQTLSEDRLKEISMKGGKASIRGKKKRDRLKAKLAKLELMLNREDILHG